MKLGSVGALG